MLIDELEEGGGEPWVRALEIEHGLDVFREAGEDLCEVEWAVAAECEGPAVPAEGDGAEGLVVSNFELAAMEPDVDFDDVGAGASGFVDQGEAVAVAVGDEEWARVRWHAVLPQWQGSGMAG